MDILALREAPERLRSSHRVLNLAKLDFRQLCHHREKDGVEFDLLAPPTKNPDFSSHGPIER